MKAFEPFRIAKIGTPAPSARSFSTTLPEF